MNYRKTTVLAQEDASTAKTKVIDVELTDVISRLQIKYNSTNSTHIPLGHFAKQISKVELVDGSDVLFSLSGQEIEALMFYEYGVGRGYEMEYRSGNENRSVYDILFGRKLWDRELAFDPKAFNNPQLKITHNLVSGGSTPTASTLEVVADVFDERTITPVGFLSSKQFYAYTAPSSQANEYIDLPTDRVIRRILIEGYLADYWWDNLFSEVEVSEDNDKRKPWSLDAYDLMQYAFTKYGPYIETLVGTPAATGTDKVWYVTPVEAANVALCVMGDPTQLFLQGERSGGYIDIEVTAIKVFRAIVAGTIPHGVVPLDCGDMQDMEDWYDVTKKGSVRLRLKAGGAVAATVSLQQLRKY